MTSREEQKQATRARILHAATELLVARGYSALTTVAVQEAAGTSRGALLHHFPTAADLTRALVANLVQSNEAAARAAATRIGGSVDAVDRALTALLETMTRPAAQAEFELWAAARTNRELATVLVEAERQAGRDLRRVVDDLFGSEVVAHPRYSVIRDLSITMLRGLALSRSLRTSDRSVRATLGHWADTVRTLLTLSSA
ncbi:TetR/AcrR family transcriptional regulator [Mycobacterium sp. NPDC050853]|uniref:TetR/AcrR family transcriptional regulator n=1 Tax=Mycobacteriaceae TaxID=1762 RepID=UPI0015E040BD|nr:TetR/AcrR family transcriptional regulator [Mycobacteroides sp. LB1]